MKHFIVSLILTLVFAGTAYAADFPYADPTDFAGKKIGVVTGSMQEQWAVKDFKDSTIVQCSSFSDGAFALETGVIDAFYGSDMPLRYAVGEKPDLTMLMMKTEEIPVAAIFPKSESGDVLRMEFNKYVAGIKEDGTLKRLEEKWMDGTEDTRRFDDPSQPPNINGKIDIITQSGAPPFDYVKNGEACGFEVEIAREFCRMLGYQPVFHSGGYDSAIIAVNGGKYDMGVAALMITEERAKSVNFSDTLCICNGALLVRKSDLAGTGIVNTDEKQNLLTTVTEGFKRTFIEEDRWKLFASGIGVTFLITVLSVLFGTAVGFGLYLLCRNGNKAANTLVNAVNWLVTGMPLVVFLMVLFYIIFAKSELSGMAVAVIGFTIVFALTMFHLIESGERAVPIGQKEAAYALGYGKTDTFIRIILPQAAMHFLPSYQIEVISLVKATAIVGYITVMDITKIGDVVRGRTYDAFFPLFAVVLSYFLLCAVFKAAVGFLMNKVDTRKRARSEIMKGVQVR